MKQEFAGSIRSGRKLATEVARSREELGDHTLAVLVPPHINDDPPRTSWDEFLMRFAGGHLDEENSDRLVRFAAKIGIDPVALYKCCLQRAAWEVAVNNEAARVFLNNHLDEFKGWEDAEECSAWLDKKNQQAEAKLLIETAFRPAG